MSAIVVRPVQPEDLEGFFDVRALTYNDGNPIPEDRREFKLSRGYAAINEGEVQGIMSLLDLTCTRGAATLDCAGVAAVAVYPHRRKSGVGTTMLKWLPRHLREVGTPLSSLYAFREPFYRRAGYEVCGKRLKITCPTGRIPRVSTSLTVNRLKPEDWRKLDACYSAFAHARSGFSLRTEPLWGRVLGENRPLTIYAAGDPVEAYAVVSHSTGFWTTDHISDFAWSTLEGYRAIMEVLAGIAINKTALTWFEPSDSPMYATYLDQGVLAQVERPIMYRLCDVPGAFRQLVTDESGEFTLRVRDDVIPENEGPWRIAFSPDGVAVERCDDADLEIDVRNLVQAFLGEPSIMDLARIDLVDVKDRAALKSASRLLPALPVTCNDFF